MLTQREIISTLEMLRNETLDVRTVTLGINLLDCAGSDLGMVRRRIAERLMRLAGQLVPVCDRVGELAREPGRVAWGPSLFRVPARLTVELKPA